MRSYAILHKQEEKGVIVLPGYTPVSCCSQDVLVEGTGVLSFILRFLASLLSSYEVSIMFEQFLIYTFQVPSNKAKCAKFFRKCLEFLSEQDHLVFYPSCHSAIFLLY